LYAVDVNEGPTHIIPGLETLIKVRPDDHEVAEAIEA
jgi:hypothetical protein